MKQYKAFIFDVDGVLVDSPHEMAWGEALRALMEGEWSSIAGSTRWTAEGYTTEVYQAQTAGKARKEGALGLFKYFGIPDPDGNRLKLYCERKQAMILGLIERGEFRAFDDAIRLLVRAKRLGLKVAAASSSKNANMMLAKVAVADYESTLIDLFDANVCGRDFEKGKPHPAIFLAAACALEIDPAECIVVEDAPSGVKAAKAGGMSCIGIARLGDEELLRSAGADWIVNSMDMVELTVERSIKIKK
jgi:beta-phosphoglucomutase-like phosphatase (HAD superfamily)